MISRVYEGQYSAIALYGAAAALRETGISVEITVDYNRFGKKIVTVTADEATVGILDRVYQETRDVLPTIL